jgi:serine/threonine-protein phosphatase PGAM5
VILIRHGQYVEDYPEDERRVLTELGRKQAESTGRRLAEMANEGGVKFKYIHQSDMARAKETGAQCLAAKPCACVWVCVRARRALSIVPTPAATNPEPAPLTPTPTPTPTPSPHHRVAPPRCGAHRARP